MISSDVHCLKGYHGDFDANEDALSLSRYKLRIRSPDAASRDSWRDDYYRIDDEDNCDLFVKRRRRCEVSDDVYVQQFNLLIRHRVSTLLEDVGQQLWRGAFLLIDFLVAKRTFLHLRKGVFLELGGGVGIVSIVLRILAAKWIITTDYTDEICELAARNIERNEHLVPLSPDESTVLVRGLDWFDSFNPREILGDSSSINTAPARTSMHAQSSDAQSSAQAELCDTTSCNGNGSLTTTLPSTMADAASFQPENCVFHWTHKDKQLLQENPVTWLASDVIYDDKLTEALFTKLDSMMKTGETLWLALEKRFNFTIEEMSVVAHGYRKFLMIINAEETAAAATATATTSVTVNEESATLSARTSSGATEENRELRADEQGTNPLECGSNVCSAASEPANGKNSTATSVLQPGPSRRYFMPSGRYFVGSRVPLTFPQCILCYDRTKDLEMWKIEIRRNTDK
jgi:predicted nicotinamide N-methyase